MRRRKLAIGLICLSATFGACGGGDEESGATDEEQVQAMVDEFTAALSRGDGDATCDYMTEGLINKFEVPGISHCAGLLGEHLGSLVVSKVTVTGEEATIAFEGYDTSWQAVKVGDEWLLDEIR